GRTGACTRGRRELAPRAAAQADRGAEPRSGVRGYGPVSAELSAPRPARAPTLAELRHRSRAVGVDELKRDSSPWTPGVRVELGCCLLDRDHNVRGCADGPTEIEDVQPTEVAGGERVRLTVHFPMYACPSPRRSHGALEFLVRIRCGHRGLEIHALDAVGEAVGSGGDIHGEIGVVDDAVADDSPPVKPDRAGRARRVVDRVRL